MHPDYRLLLPRDKAESERLNEQHIAMKEAVGYLLSPQIQEALLHRDAPIRIAEVATGTGVWLLDLAASYDRAFQGFGFDISDEQFVPLTEHEHLPNKCEFHELNILEPIPERWRFCFDVVHIRLLYGVLTSEGWDVAAKNIHDLLRPGGWVQWNEANMNSFVACAAIPDAPTDHGQEMINILLDSFHREQKALPEDFARFRETVEAAGFEDCLLTRPASDRLLENRNRGSAVVRGGVGAALKHLANFRPGFPLTRKEVDELCKKADEELTNGKAYWRMDLCVVTGRRL